ncbi:NAD(P)H-dependent oxidoreductase [Chryseolinea lacunae]|uniref:NAD(P)H-dependent oxidoreductase n=1 Tax=Chryseolinea lacunae TaxID=2801331 RepID=A0ABS1KPC3_9BACT|nr:NAD(P)H-dependent oxidoreductase [Chryseolinea lacunae]MBL0741087.1 NAD(P)H-dependent oxidoreductase [Chryseolinea lacunae]
MKHLVVYAHPNPASLNHHFLQTVVRTLEAGNHHVVVRDLNNLNFNPVLSLEDIQQQRKGVVEETVAVEQEFIAWAEVITFVYPIWWTGMPAILKGYIDRVMSYGFAYRYDQGIQKGLLTGKATIIINTHGKSNAEYAATGMDRALSLTSDKGIYTYCGLDVLKHFFFDRADRPSIETVAAWTEEVKTLYEEQFEVARIA